QAVGEMQRTLGQPKARRVLPWDWVPDKAPEKVVGLRVLPEDQSYAELPECVRRIRGLVHLEFPLEFVKRLRPDSIPASVKSLQVTGDGSATVPENVILPSLQ